MSAKNIYHDAVINALAADGWTITHDPLTVTYGGKDLFVDLGAERSAIGAERSGQRIAVEIQSFLSRSPVRDLEEAVGQYNVYCTVLAETEPSRAVYLAVPRRVQLSILAEPLGQLVVAKLALRLMVFDEFEQKVVQWISYARYREIVGKIIAEYAGYKPSHGQIETEAVVDRERDHYEVLHVGWDGIRRIHGSVIHIDIHGGKVWIQYDGTSRPVADELIAAGVPREDIVLGFHPAELRQLSGFGAG